MDDDGWGVDAVVLDREGVIWLSHNHDGCGVAAAVLDRAGVIWLSHNPLLPCAPCHDKAVATHA
jgi:hypothetical protein